MRLVLAVTEDGFKPIFCDAEKLGAGFSNVLVQMKDERIKARIVSSPFDVTDEAAEGLVRWYGVEGFPRIVGWYEYKEAMFDAEV